MANRGTTRAFTFIELLLAMTILAILVTMAVPSMGRSVRRLGLRDAALTLASNLRYAQTKAITEAAPVRVTFRQGSGEYYLETSSRDGAAPMTRVAGVAGRTFQLPEGVTFAKLDLLADDGVTAAEALTFQPDGRGSLGTIRIAGADGTLEVSLTRRLGQIVLSDITAPAKAGGAP
jgi:prepilin-type N-terminal cleavage/methylation domain-containing protein